MSPFLAKGAGFELERPRRAPLPCQHDQCVSDVLRLNEELIRFVGKLGSHLIIPLHAELRKILAAAQRDHVTILNTAFGRPFSVDGFSQFMRDAIKGAGLPLECQPHGLRKAAGRRLAEAGCSAREIMSILGHKTLSEAERYTRDADQEKLAKAAIVRLETGQKGNKVPKPGAKSLGIAPIKKVKSK